MKVGVDVIASNDANSWWRACREKSAITAVNANCRVPSIQLEEDDFDGDGDDDTISVAVFAGTLSDADGEGVSRTLYASGCLSPSGRGTLAWTGTEIMARPRVRCGDRRKRWEERGDERSCSCGRRRRRRGASGRRVVGSTKACSSIMLMVSASIQQFDRQGQFRLLCLHRQWVCADNYLVLVMTKHTDQGFRAQYDTSGCRYDIYPARWSDLSVR